MIDTILDENQLEERLTLPSERDIAAASQLEGDVIILGAGGKMGPSLAVRMGRAIQGAGLKHRVIAVVRKDRYGAFRRLSDRVEVVEADRNYVKITVGREVFHARSTLQQAEKSLQSQPMLRISRSCLVNMRHVREISRTPRGDAILVLVGGATVTSSEGFRESVRQYLDTLKIGPS